MNNKIDLVITWVDDGTMNPDWLQEKELNLMLNGQNQTTPIDTDHQKISSIGSTRSIERY